MEDKIQSSRTPAEWPAPTEQGKTNWNVLPLLVNAGCIDFRKAEIPAPVKKFSALLCAAILIFASATSALAAPQAELWARWTIHDADSTASIDHAAWDSFLQKYVSERDGVNLLDYAAAGDDRQALQAYLSSLGAIEIGKFNRNEQRAFWINLYNALTIETILAHYPVASIRDVDISPGFLSNGPWGKKMFAVEKEMLSLDDIEHRILRPIWKDARIHYAVNCASIGCPNLARRAFTAGNAEELLETGARDYVNHPRGAAIIGGELQVSSIYKWFSADFGGDDAGIIMHLKKYATSSLREQLGSISSIADDGYDWSLNDKRGK